MTPTAAKFRGRHAPNSLRDAFCEMVYALHDAQQDDALPIDEYLKLTGKLWNCSDCLPSTDCTLLEEMGWDGRHKWSYGAAARWLSGELLMEAADRSI